MRVLCLDIEGGWGGSSRSLYESIRHLHRDVDIEIWCRREGPIQSRYEALGVPCRVTPDMPHVSSLPRLSRNIYAYGRFVLGWPKSRKFRNELAKAAQERFDLIHFNHEGLFLLLCWLRRRLGRTRAMTMHVRTVLPATAFSRWQYGAIVDAADRLVFITENEKARVADLAGRRVPGEVIYNIVTPPGGPVAADPSLASDKRFKVAVLSNYAWIRGLDRLIDVACELRKRGRYDVLFVMAGNMALTGSLPGPLRGIARRGGNLVEYARERGVTDMFRFLGHVADPAPVLAACDILAKPTREYNPWGRDILEAMAFGKPVFSVGTYDRFLDNGVTGVLRREFDAEDWAKEMMRLADNREACRALGVAGARRVADLCDGPARASDLLSLWRDAIQPVNTVCAA